MARRRAVAGGALLLGAFGLALAPIGAEAATLTQVGWWWRVNDPVAMATLPAPPTVPEGALMVAGAPDGATAIAALRFDLDEGEGSPVLTLDVADSGDQGGERAVLAACLTGSAWQPEQGGAWTSKPFPACEEASVTGVRAEDGGSWTFALAPLLSDGIVDVTLVPGIDPDLPDGANGSTFQLVFAPPTAASLATTSGEGPSAPIDLPGFDEAPAAAAPADGSFSAPSLGGDLALPPAPVAGGFTPSLPAEDQGLTATAPVVQQRNAPLPATTPLATAEDHRALGVVILALCGAALLWSAQLPTPAPRRLGGLDAAEAETAQPPGSVPPVAGLGRFARPRSGSAPPL